MPHGDSVQKDFAATEPNSISGVSALPQRFKVRESQYPHFITCAVVHWIPVFNRIDYLEVLADSFRHCIESRGLLVHAFIFMPNHFHAICSQAEGEISAVIRDLKRFTSRQLTQMMERDGRTIWLRAMQRAAGKEGEAKLWDDGFHPEQVYSEKFFTQKCNYMHDNPVRAGYIANPSEWVYSSAAFYNETGDAPIPVTPIEW
jgi:putative transposase